MSDLNLVEFKEAVIEAIDTCEDVTETERLMYEFISDYSKNERNYRMGPYE